MENQDRNTQRLTKAISKGDSRAFTQFYEMWFEKAFLMARSLTRRDEAFCLDVVQEAMLRVVKSLRTMQNEEELSRWMSRVIHTTALDLLRQEARRANREKLAVTNGTLRHEEDLDGAFDLDERVHWLEAQISLLPESDRQLLSERFEQGKTFSQTGAANGISADAAHGRFRRILERLRLAARGVFHESL